MGFVQRLLDRLLGRKDITPEQKRSASVLQPVRRRRR
jgi:hypothetical protein